MRVVLACAERRRAARQGSSAADSERRRLRHHRLSPSCGRCRVRQSQRAVMPPSTTSSVPVMKRASSLARNSTALRGVAAVAHEAERDALLALREQRVDVAAGALLGQPRLDHRRVQLARHDGVDADALRAHAAPRPRARAGSRRPWSPRRRPAPLPVQRRPEVEAMLTIAPLRCSSIVGSTCLQVRNTLLRLTSTCASHTSSAHLDRAAGRRAADVVDENVDACRRPRGTLPTIAGDALAARSRRRPWADRGARIAGAVDASPRAGRVAVDGEHRAPSSARRTAMARPLPQPAPTQPAPVTMATLSSNRRLHAHVSEAIEALQDCRPAAARARRRRGAISAIRSTSCRSSGTGPAWLGCGQSLPHTTRSPKLGDQRAREGLRVGVGRAHAA